MLKLFKHFTERRVSKKRKAQILQTATDFWNECEEIIKKEQ